MLLQCPKFMEDGMVLECFFFHPHSFASGLFPLMMKSEQKSHRDNVSGTMGDHPISIVRLLHPQTQPQLTLLAPMAATKLGFNGLLCSNICSKLCFKIWSPKAFIQPS